MPFKRAQSRDRFLTWPRDAEVHPAKYFNRSSSVMCPKFIGSLPPGYSAAWESDLGMISGSHETKTDEH